MSFAAPGRTSRDAPERALAFGDFEPDELEDVEVVGRPDRRQIVASDGELVAALRRPVEPDRPAAAADRRETTTSAGSPST